MTEINERNDDAYYDAYDEDIAAGHVKPVRTTLRTSSTRSSGGAPTWGRTTRLVPAAPRPATCASAPPPTRRSPSTSEPTALPGVPSSATPSRSTSPAPEPPRPSILLPGVAGAQIGAVVNRPPWAGLQCLNGPNPCHCRVPSLPSWTSDLPSQPQSLTLARRTPTGGEPHAPRTALSIPAVTSTSWRASTTTGGRSSLST